MSSFATYLIGFVILILGLGFAAHLLGAPPTWIAVGAIVLLGIGVLMATSRTKPRDPPAPPSPPAGRTY
jgi:hypothetical protein